TRELEQINDRLAAMSATDGLTGIANRRRFDEVLANEWSRSSRSAQPLMLAMLDVDLFKQYNDRYGHHAGDDVLRAVATELAAHVRRSGDFVARYGGEEFAITSTSMDEAHALLMTSNICNAIESLRIAHLDSPSGVLTVSIGVVVAVPTADTSVISF